MAVAAVAPRIPAMGAPAPVRPQPFDVCSLGKHIWALYTNAMDEGGKVVKDIVKLTSFGCYWTRFANPSSPAVLERIGTDMRQMKNVMSAVAVPYKAGQVAEKVDAFFQKPSFQAVWDVVGKVCSLINEVDDTRGAVTHYLPKGTIPEATDHLLSGINYTATVIGAGKGVSEDAMEIAAKEGQLTQHRNKVDAHGAPISDQASAERITNTSNAITLHWVNLASKAAYVALGIIGLASLAFGMVGAPLVVTGIIACLTIGTTLSLFGFFYERILDPEGKTAAKYNKQLTAVQETTSRTALV